MDEGATEGEQPDDGEDDGQAGDDFGVDEGALRPARSVFDRVQVVTSDAGHDSCKGQLSKEKG